MSKHKHIVLFAGVFFLFATACCKKNRAKATDLSKEGYTAAMVVDYQLDGCKWMIVLPDQAKLEPDQVPQEFQKDSTNVWVKFEERKGAMSICMAGKPVHVIDIKKR